MVRPVRPTRWREQLLDDDRLADAGAAEDADLAALLERADEVDDLEARLEHLDLGGLVIEGRRRAVDRQVDGRVHGTLEVDRATEDVEHPTQGRLADRHRDRGARVDDLGAACKPVGRGHRNAAHPVVAQVLGNLADERIAACDLDLDRVQDLGQLARGELDVDHRSGDLDDAALGHRGCGCRHVVFVLLGTAQRACAPVAISIISRVMLVWRALL